MSAQIPRCNTIIIALYIIYFFSLIMHPISYILYNIINLICHKLYIVYRIWYIKNRILHFIYLYPISFIINHKIWILQDHTGPYGTIRDHLGPYVTMRDHTGPYCTIQDHTGPSGILWDHLGP